MTAASVRKINSPIPQYTRFLVKITTKDLLTILKAENYDWNFKHLYEQINALMGEPGIDWVICGGESGHGARPMHPDWARSLRDQCQAAGVAFLFKQWGEHEVDEIGPEDQRSPFYPPGHVIYRKVGKKAAGRLLGGREWNEVPE